MKHMLDKIAVLVLIVCGTGCGGKKAEINAQDMKETLSAALLTEITTTTETSGEAETGEQTTVTTTQAVQTETEQADDTETETSGNVLNVTPLNQYPELATGCEITSLTMALNYMGLDADKCDLSDNYLDKGPVGTVDFRVAFEGDPRDGNSYGCYAPVIRNTAEKYISAKGAELTATDLTGSELEDLFEYIDKGVPVIVWGTLDCREGHYSVTWNVDGKDLTWFTPEHCMLLVGYDDTTVTVADPSHGDIRSYDRQLFKSRYGSLKNQAVVITTSLS